MTRKKIPSIWVSRSGFNWVKRSEVQVNCSGAIRLCSNYDCVIGHSLPLQCLNWWRKGEFLA